MTEFFVLMQKGNRDEVIAFPNIPLSGLDVSNLLRNKRITRQTNNLFSLFGKKVL